MKNPANGIKFWPYEVTDAEGVVTTGVIPAPTAASAAWHVKHFVATTAQVRFPDDGEAAA